MLEINRIYNEDCLEGMNNIDNGSIDMVLCDPPYGMTAPEWDKSINLNRLWIQYNRVIKKTGTIAIFASQPFTTQIISSNLKDFRYCWYWIKNQGTNFFHAKSMPIRKVEEICIFKKGKYYPQYSQGHIPTQSSKGQSIGKVYYGINSRNVDGGKTSRFPTNILEFKCVDNYNRLHSAQKPVDLVEYLISTYTDKNDLILDSYIGSGTTALAARNTDRNYIGFELDTNYFNLANKRLREG